MKSSKRLLCGAWIGAVALAAGACTEADNELIENIGVTRLVLIHPGLAPQSLDSAADTIQVAEWDVTTAVLLREGSDLDLLIGENCIVTDTATLSPTFDGACSGGLVVEALDQPEEIRLKLVTTMRVARGRPLVLTEPDHDGDGFRNGAGPDSDNPCKPGQTPQDDCDDNCTLVSNPDQADTDGDRLGDLCTVSVVSSGVLVPVSDADGDTVPDTLDNCIWMVNADQDFADPIGDECEQIAEVQLDSIPTILGPTELLTIDGSNSFVVVDFGDTLASGCDWKIGVCTQVEVKLCGRSSGSSALLGC